MQHATERVNDLAKPRGVGQKEALHQQMREEREEVTVAGVCVLLEPAALCNPCHLRHLEVFNPSKSIWSAQILYMEQNGPETEMVQPRLPRLQPIEGRHSLKPIVHPS